MKLIKKRQVRNKYIYVAFASLVLMCLSYYGYHRFKIGYGIAIESRHYFKKAKAFFFNYEFFGNVVDRKYIEGDATAYFIVVRLDSDIIIPEWGRTFYYNYYVYKYTLGMTVALAIVKRILNGDTQQVERYLNFLKSGGKESPVDLLSHAGVDPLDDAIYDDAFHYFEDLLNEFEKLVK